MNFKYLYQNKNIYLLIMIVLLSVIAFLDAYKLSTLLIKVLLILFYVFLLLRYHFLNYSIIFLIIVGLLCLTSVFHADFIQFLGQFSNNKLVELYLLKGGSNITMIVIFLLFIYSFLSQQKVKNEQ